MRRISFVLLAAAGCTHVGSGGSLGAAPKSEEASVERIDTPAGAFLVRDRASADFKKLLAGEPAQHPYFAGGDSLAR
jgi:hypothetical protein